MFGEDEELRRRIITAFLAELPEQIREIESALLNDRGEALRRAAHYFKTSAGVISAKRLKVILTELETAAADRDLLPARQLWETAEPALVELRKELEEFRQ